MRSSRRRRTSRCGTRSSRRLRLTTRQRPTGASSASMGPRSGHCGSRPTTTIRVNQLPGRLQAALVTAELALKTLPALQTR